MKLVLQKNSLLDKLRSLDSGDRAFLVLLIILLLERLISLCIMGVPSVVDGDDVAYINAGIEFARSGKITVWTDEPTARIMPGAPILLGFISLIFGDGIYYMLVSKLLCICFGCIAAIYTYKAACLYIPKPFAILAAAGFLLPNHAWVDNIISTETPYTCFFCACLYYSLRMTKDDSRSCTIKYAVSFLLALVFRANIIIMPVFTALHLILCRRYTTKELVKKAALFCAISMIFFVPWTIRNYVRFHVFIPVSCGAADPTLKGTYQGHGYPEDSELDYETNVNAVIREKYAGFYNDDGSLHSENSAEYIEAKRRDLMAEYRIKEWIKRDPLSFLKSYLIEKPLSIQTWPYYWGQAADIVKPVIGFFLKLNFAICAIGFLLSLALKKKREIMISLSLLYWVNVYILAMSFCVERYAALLLPIRYIISGIAIYIAADTLREKLAQRKKTV